VRQKSVNDSVEAKHGILKTRWDMEKEVLKTLAKRRYKPEQIARQHYLDVRTIHRIRAKAIRDFPHIKRKLPRTVQDYLRSWAEEHGKELVEGIPYETRREKLKQHEEDLCKAANDILDKLYEYCTWPRNITIEEINVERNEPEATGFFTKKVIIGLLAHLQTDVEELKRFVRWEDLTPNDISKDLLDSISTKAAKREFKGKCNLCQDY